MIDILSGHIDYIYFSTSLAFLFLAAVCLTAGNTRGQGLPWIWLGLFAATQVAWQWLELIAFSYFGGMYAETSRAALLAASFVFLVEFGRAGMANILGRGPERWVHLPLLVLAALCLFVELCQFKSSALLVLGCTAGLWAPLTLYMYSTIEKQPAGRGILRTISFALFLYAGINVLTLINVPFIPNEQDNFTTALIRILLGLLASCIALSGWMYLLAGSYKAGSPARRNYILAVVITFLGILVAGWLVTGLAGSQGAAQASHNLLSRTLTAASAVDAGMVASLEGSGAGLNTPEYFYLREQLRSIKQVNKDCRFVYLLGQRDGKVIFFVDAEPEQSIDYSAPGDLYNDSSPELMTVFSTGQPLVEGPLQDQWGDWVSGLAAISDPDSNLVIAVLGMDVAADDWQRLISVYRMAAFFIITIISLITIGFTIALQLNWQTANRLAASRARFEAIFKNAPEAIVIFEEDTGRILGTNPFMSHWTGFSKAELGELVIGDLINPGTASQEYLIEVLKSGSEITCHCRKRDSTLVEAEMTGAMLNYQGRKCLLVFLHDVTERRSREKMLTQQASAIEASMDGIAITDDSGRYLFMNEAYAKIYGYDLPEEPMGKNWSTLYYQQEIAWLEKEVFPELLQRGYWRGESMGIKRNGTMFPQDVSLSRIDGGGLVCIVRDITERKLAQDKIEYLAYYDALTGLPNRTLFKNRLALALVQANRDKKMLAVMFLDLDRFKFTNDTLGHSAGDKLLQRVSRRLAKCVRQGDTIARIGGDEFTLLLQELSRIEDAARVAQKINGVLQRPVGINGYEIDISASIGIAIYPDDGEDVETLLKNADIAMYQAKGTGGNSYRFYDPAMNVRTLERLVLQNNLRYALQREEFILHYQPQVDVRTGKVTGVEALLRWQHPELGLVLPSEFISQAEDTGLIVPVGEWVLKTACIRNKDWQEAGLSPLSVAVNLSARQFQQPNMVDTVARVLKDTGLSPGWLVLEITEGVLMQDIELTMATLQKLRGMGIKIYIDDFGTGYSSLSYLKKFPVDGIKIDKSFVSDLSCSVSDRAIVTAIIVLAQRLGLEVVAEGVETNSQLAFLRQQGCSKLQGYLFSKPVPADEIDQMLW